MRHSAEDSDYGVVNRLVALRDPLGRGPLTAQEIKEQLDYPIGSGGNRQFQRDIRALRAMGYGVRHERATRQYHLTISPHLELDDDEVEALALIRESFEATGPKAAEVGRVLEKIAAALPEAQKQGFYRKPPLALNLKPAIDYRPHAANIRLLEQKIAQGQLVRFNYQSSGESKLVLHRQVEPYELQFFDRHFYLIGYSREFQNVLEFRIDRIRDLEPLTARFGGRKTRRTLAFKYRLSAKVARSGVSERFLDQKVLHYLDGDPVVSAEGYSEFRILQDLMRYRDQAELLEPPDLRQKMREVVRKMWEMYEEG